MRKADGHLQDQSEFLVQQRFYPKTEGIQDTHKEEVVTISFGLETSGGGSSLSYNTLLPLKVSPGNETKQNSPGALSRIYLKQVNGSSIIGEL